MTHSELVFNMRIRIDEGAFRMRIQLGFGKGRPPETG